MNLKYKEDLVITSETGNKILVRFLRVEITELRKTIEEIIYNIANLSWINNFSGETLKKCFIERATPTIEKLCNNLKNNIDSNEVNEIGEIVVSNVGRLIIEQTYNYYVLPLAEIIKEQLSNNPGFDYHCVTKEDIPIFGEAKYVAGKNAYGKALSQVANFIEEAKDIKEAELLYHFISNSAYENIGLGNKGYSISFSSTDIENKELLNNITKNNDFKKLLEYKEIIVVAVDV